MYKRQPLYSLDSSRVDYGLARGLYKNNKDDYKLGAGFAKPIIDTIPSFMGIPKIKGENDNIQEILDSFFNENISRVQDVHKNACRDGDCFVWITREKNNSILYPELKTKLSFNIIPPEQISRIRRDIVTGKPIEYILKSEYSWVDENNQNKKAIITQRISEEYKVTEIDGDMPDGRCV